MTTTSRRTITVDGVTVCGNVQGSVPGAFLSVTNSVAGACPSDPPPPVPPGRITRLNLSYNYGNGQNVNNVDTTDMKPVFGRINATSPLQPFPYAQGSHPLFYNVPKTGWFGFSDVVPLDIPPSLSLSLYHSETMPGPFIDCCVSTNLGDFTAGKTRMRVGPGGVAAKLMHSPVSNFDFRLVPGQRFYIMVRFNQPVPVDALGCAGPSCYMGLTLNHSD